MTQCPIIDKIPRTTYNILTKGVKYYHEQNDLGF